MHRKIFLSTLPARGATALDGVIQTQLAISIHAPREGSDSVRFSRAFKAAYFYPRSPRGERLMCKLI